MSRTTRRSSSEVDVKLAGDERIERRDSEVHVFMTGIRSHFTPENVVVDRGDLLVRP